MNKKFLSIISAMALTVSTATALTSNAIVSSSKDFIWDKYEKLDVTDDMMFAGNDFLYMNCLENDKDGLAQIYEVNYVNNHISFILPETADIDAIREKINGVNSGLILEHYSPYPNYPWTIEAEDENNNKVDISVSDIKAIFELFKDETFEVYYHFPYYSYGTAYFDRYGLLTYDAFFKENLEKYLSQNNLDYEIIVPEGLEEYALGDFITLIPNEELTDLECFYLAQDINKEVQASFHCLYPDKGNSTSKITIENSYLNGDANKDEKLTLADSVAVLQSIANPDKYALSMEGEFNAEVDGEDGITVNDALIIRQWGLENTRG